MRNFRHYATGKSSKLAGPGHDLNSFRVLFYSFFLWIRISFPDPESSPDMDEEQKDEPDRQAHDTPGGQAEGGPDRQAGTEQIAR